MTYQRKVEKILGREFEDLIVGQWLEFVDEYGRGFAQPDIYLVGPHSVVVFEAKLTQRDSALSQIGQLYRPLLRFIYKRPVVGVLVCKNLRKDPGKWAIKSPGDVLDLTDEHIYTWHWLG
jgi:hypothetical protein